MKIDSTGLWLVKFRGNEEAEVIRIIKGTIGIGTGKREELLTCRDTGNPSKGAVPFFATEKHLEKVFRKIKDPLRIK